MANRTIKDAKTLHGTNPQYLVEKIIRTRIYESRYWKEECFALNAELIVDKGIELRYIGGIYGGNIKPTPFLCLLLKMLQIQPTKDIIIEFIRQEDYKYIRALGAFYLRLTGTSLEAWKYLEPLYNDYRKLRHMDRMGKFSVMHMDEFIDILLREDRVFDVILPRISKRHVHEEAGILEPRVSVLEEDINNVESDEEETNAVATDRDAEKNRENKPEVGVEVVRLIIRRVRDRKVTKEDAKEACHEKGEEEADQDH
ncbi:pre-mRNA-splicing factor 38A-like protein, partial [Dinothrombium tinctorium]